NLVTNLPHRPKRGRQFSRPSADNPVVRSLVLRGPPLGAALLGLWACSTHTARYATRVPIAELRSGTLPVGMPICVQGAMTSLDGLTGALTVQDNSAAIRFANLGIAGDGGERVEVCGETRQTANGMSLARPRAKVLGQAGLPVPAHPT